MAWSRSDLLRLLESTRTADGVETIRVLCERMLTPSLPGHRSVQAWLSQPLHSHRTTTVPLVPPKTVTHFCD